jgi:hypothetical protein
MFGHGWDEAEPDDRKMEELLNSEIDRYWN